jgi:hypothetical protein
MPNPQQLELVRCLSQEITAALSAIERNDLQAFRSAIGNQERISNQLSLLQQSSLVRGPVEHSQIQKAYSDLAQLNRVYAGVIKRSKRCADVLLALYGRCDTGYTPAGMDREGLACEA